MARTHQNTGEVGIVYLVHIGGEGLLNRVTPHGPVIVRHYIGWTGHWDFDARIEQHRNGSGAKLLKAANERGLPWEVVRKWEGVDRHFERLLKRRRSGTRLCPECVAAGRTRGERIEGAKYLDTGLHVCQDG